MATADSRSQRILALDFTKGVLILFMVVYHWTVYFARTSTELFMYLRFLTPSFIFITGFLVSAVYFRKYAVNYSAISRRLAWRGTKILGLFVFLNVLVSMLPGHFEDQPAYALFHVQNLINIYVIGNTVVPGVGKLAYFVILIPISFLLLLSAGLLMMQPRSHEVGSRENAARVKLMFCGMWVLFLAALVLLYLKNIESSNLELLSMGFLGALLGHVPLQRINGLVNHPYLLGIAYVGYVVAITIWNVMFPLQIIGVCLSLLIIYLMGTAEGHFTAIRERIIVIGRYSLLGYIGQIAVIQLLFRGLRQFSLGTVQMGASLLGAVFLTVLFIEVVDRVRGRSATMDKMYRAVFA